MRKAINMHDMRKAAGCLQLQQFIPTLGISAANNNRLQRMLGVFVNLLHGLDKISIADTAAHDQHSR